MFNKCAFIVGGLVMLMSATSSFSHHCPSHFSRNSDGRFVSDEAPGWHSYVLLEPKVSLDAKQFSGALYIPDRHQIACVYKASNDQWIALTSNPRHAFNEDDLKIEVWNYDADRGEFNCGKPNKNRLACEFTVHS